MATVKAKTHKDGTTAYEIRVSLGRDLNGKQILKYTTWAPEPGMTPAKIKKELERQKVLFEDACRNGEVLDKKTRFADVAAKWLSDNEKHHSPAYQKRARALLVRINAAIGHLRVGDIKPHHLQSFYDALETSGEKDIPGKAVSTTLLGTMKGRKMTRAALAAAAGVAPNTITMVCQGKAISEDSANKIASALGLDTDTVFKVTRTSEPLSAKTIQHHHRLISSILSYAVEQEIIASNPAQKAKAPKVPKKEAAYLDDKQALQVVEALAAAPLKWRTVIMILIYSGMRRGELCGLLWSDIDLEHGIVDISKANQYLPEKGIFEKDTKTDSSARVINIPLEMVELLQEYHRWQDDERAKAGSKWHNTGKVFTQDNGKPMHPDSITGWVANFREENSLPYFSPHSLRHTAATLLIMRGVPVKAVSARLGHANQNVTNAIYSHSIQTADALAAGTMADILSPDKKEK